LRAGVARHHASVSVAVVQTLSLATTESEWAFGLPSMLTGRAGEGIETRSNLASGRKNQVVRRKQRLRALLCGAVSSTSPDSRRPERVRLRSHHRAALKISPPGKSCTQPDDMDGVWLAESRQLNYAGVLAAAAPLLDQTLGPLDALCANTNQWVRRFCAMRSLRRLWQSAVKPMRLR
jgi:hypothetical protein